MFEEDYKRSIIKKKTPNILRGMIIQSLIQINSV